MEVPLQGSIQSRAQVWLHKRSLPCGTAIYEETKTINYPASCDVINTVGLFPLSASHEAIS